MKTLRDIIENAFRELFPTWSPEDVEILARTLEHEGYTKSDTWLADKINIESEKANVVSAAVVAISLKAAEITDLKQQNERLETALMKIKKCNDWSLGYGVGNRDIKDILEEVFKKEDD